MVSGARRGDRHRLVRWCALDSGGGAGMQEGFLQDCHRPSRLWMLQHPHGSGRRLTACGRTSIRKTRRVAAAKAGSTAAPLALPRQTQRGPGNSHETVQQSVPHRSRQGGQHGGQHGGWDGAWGGVARLPTVLGRCCRPKECSLPQFTNFGLGRGTSSAASGPGSSGRRGKG